MSYTKEEVGNRLIAVNCCYKDLVYEAVQRAKKGNMCKEDWDKLIVILIKKKVLSDYYDEYLNAYTYLFDGEYVSQELHCLTDDLIDKIFSDLEKLFNSAFKPKELE